MKSHGTGRGPWEFAARGDGVVLEEGVLVFHAEHIRLGSDIYIGHQTILKAYHRNELVIADGVWIGQQCFLHSAGGIVIQEKVGIGPGVKILSSAHELKTANRPILEQALEFAPVVIEAGADIGVNAVILPGVTVGACAQVGAGAVVTRSVAPHTVVAGVPAVEIRRWP